MKWNNLILKNLLNIRKEILKNTHKKEIRIYIEDKKKYKAKIIFNEGENLSWLHSLICQPQSKF